MVMAKNRIIGCMVAYLQFRRPLIVGGLAAKGRSSFCSLEWRNVLTSKFVIL